MQQTEKQQQSTAFNNFVDGEGDHNSPKIQQGSYAQTTIKRPQISGGRFDFEDGGTYCGGWDEGKAHGHGVCTGPKHQGAYAGAWNYGFEVSGAYIWPSGSHYEGQWQNGRRHGLGVEQIGRQLYRGEWSKDGHKGRYGVRESTVSTAKYEGTWNLGYQDGYGCETYADGGKYQGQWQEGKRHGYGIRTSAPFGLASHHRRKNLHASLSSLRSNENGDAEKRNNKSEEVRGGFVLTAKSDKLPVRRNSLNERSKKGFLMGLKMRKQRSTGDLEKRGTLGSGSIRSTMSTASWLSTGSEQSNLTTKSTHTESNASFTMEDEQLDPTVVETYMGEWKKDKRCGYGIAERSDGLKYEGEWYNNKKHGYGVTTFRDGTFEEGKYKNNILITSQKKKHLFLARSRKFRERITASVNSAQRALKMAMQRSDIAISRTATASTKALNADSAADQARMDCEMAVQMAREFAPDFKPSVLERFEKLRYRERFKATTIHNNAATNNSNPSDNLTSTSFHHQQHIHHGLQKNRQQSHAAQNDSEFPIPSSMYSQQLPVSPQTDLSLLVNQSGHNSINSISQNYQSKEHQKHHLNLAYQFQQQQPPGNGITIMSKEETGQTKLSQNVPIKNFSNTSISQMQKDHSMFKYAETSNMLNNMHIMEQQHFKLPQSNNFQQQSVESSFNQSSNQNRRQSQQSIDNNRAKAPLLSQSSQQSSIDYFDHYKRPPSRDSSIDRYTRAASRLSGGFGSRQTSVDRGATAANSGDLPITSPEIKQRSGSIFRSATPVPTTITPTENGVGPGNLSRAGTPSLQNHTLSNATEPTFSSPNQPFEDVLLRQRTLGQDIIPSPLQPKRTESLYLPAKPNNPSTGVMIFGSGASSKKQKSVPININLQRKKSLPDFQELPKSTEAMSREEVSALGSARREAVRRQIEINERLRANPLLYLVSPQVKDWFSRQQLVLLVLIANVVLAILFFKMLT